MRFDKTNLPLRLLNLQDNLYGDFTIGWNLARSNTLGFRLVDGSIDGLTKINPRFADGFTSYAFGLLFLEAGVAFRIIWFYLLGTCSTCASKKFPTLRVAIKTKHKWLFEFLGACFARMSSSRHLFYRVRYLFL